MAIPNVILKSVSRAPRFAPSLPVAARLFVLVLASTIAATAADWSAPEQQLARKIAALVGSGPISMAVENRSSLGRRDIEIIQNGLRATIEAMGVHFAQNEQTAATVTISLSENMTSYVWVAQVRRGSDEPAIAMISTPRPASATIGHDAVPLSLRKIFLWRQAEPILDVAVLEESTAPTRIAVLDAERVSLYRSQAGNWQREQALPIAHNEPWPRDLRGRLVQTRDGLDTYLPGVVCHSAAGGYSALNCHDSKDPWPLTVSGIGNSDLARAKSANSSFMNDPTKAFFAPARNFFTGDLTSPTGKFTTAPPFYSAALLQREENPVWLFAGVDGQLHIFDGTADRSVELNWDSDLAGVRTSCGAGWQALVTSPADGVPESVRAYEVPDRDPVAVSTAIDVPGAISALWTEARGDTAVVVARNPETGNYEAFRLALACGQ